MLVYVVKKTGLVSLNLPSRVYGSYWVRDFKDNGDVRDLINIKERDGKWVANSNKKVSIVIGGKEVEEVSLQDYQHFILKFKNRDEVVEIYISPTVDKTMKKFKYQKIEQLTVGSGRNNDIVCINQLLDDLHIKIYNRDNCWFVEDNNTKHGTFVNNNYVNGTYRVFYGDIIFLMGIKIIFLDGFIYINNPLDTVFCNNSIFSEVSPSNTIGNIEFVDNDEVVELYNESDYFVKSPRFTEVIETEKFVIEAPPNLGEEDKTPLILTMGPMVTMGMSSVVYMMSSINSLQNGGNAMSAVPMLVTSISMLAGTLLWPVLTKNYQKKERKKKVELRDNRYGEYLLAKEKDLKSILERQKQVLLSNYLSSQECYQYIIYLNRYLWTREINQDSFMSVRLGLGDVPAMVDISSPQEHFSLEDDKLEKKMHEIVDNNKKILNAPIIISLTEMNIIAITGKYQLIKPYVDTLLIQLLALQGYYEMKIIVLTNEDRISEWDYLGLVPHIWDNNREIRFLSSINEEGIEVSQYLNQIYESRLDSVKDSSIDKVSYKNFSCFYLVITDDIKNSKDYSIVKNILEHDDLNLGFGLMILHPNLANLPSECKSFISIDSAQEGFMLKSELSSKTNIRFRIEHVSNIDFMLYPMKLSNVPIENDNENYSFPKVLSFLEMYNAGLVEQLNPIDKWNSNNPIVSLGVPVGVDENGNLFKLDLHEKVHGPHGLIAGMTGSGKSEFIITYILSMAVNFHPNEVQFVLIDYKGGGLVGAFENKETGLRLPHLAGTITNLDVADINRALASIESELKRRQRLFNEARDKLGEGTIDIYKYQRYYRDGSLKEPVSHLFIISDEFAELKDQQPDFMEQLISTARIGRSLGVHLILATQKPSGVVDNQIWSNSRFRICLKVQDDTDSNEMLKRPDAAFLKDTGRFYLQVGYNEFFALGQAAWAGSKYVPQEKVYHEVDDSILFIDHIGRKVKTLDTPKSNRIVNVGEELPNIVKYLDNIAKMENINVRKLWLEKLPAIVYIDNLRKKYGYNRIAYHINPVIGEYDDPTMQSQGLLTLDFEECGNTVVYSVGDKVMLINAIIYSLITTYTSDEINIYALDMDSETLKMYQNVPQVGDVVFSSEDEKVANLFKLIESEINNRKKLFQNYNGDYRFYCDNSGNKLPAIVFILAGYENFKETFEDYEDVFAAISRDCSRYGIYCVVTAVNDRAMRMSTRSNFPNIIPLKIPGGKIEYDMLLGKKTFEISNDDGRGMVILNDNVYEFQTASICESSKLNDYIARLSASLREKLNSYAPKIPLLPEVVSFDDIIYKLKDLSSVPIGVEVESLEVSLFNFVKNYMFMITSNDVSSLKNFTSLVISEMSNINNYKLLVIDTDANYSDVVFDKSVTYLNQNIFEQFNTLINDNLQKIVFVMGIDSFVNSFSGDIKSDTDGYFSKLEKLGNCHFVFVDRFSNFKNHLYDSWFKKFVSNDNGIWIGKGLGEVTFYNLSANYRTLNMPITSSYGYIMVDGDIRQIKILESAGDIDGE